MTPLAQVLRSLHCIDETKLARFGEVVVGEAADHPIVNPARRKKPPKLDAKHGRSVVRGVLQAREIYQEDHLGFFISKSTPQPMDALGRGVSTDIFHHATLAPIVGHKITRRHHHSKIARVLEHLQFGVHGARAVHGGEAKLDAWRHVGPHRFLLQP